ncbi:MAG: MFS transporter, partial [Actinomycetota bacterium]
LRRGAPKRSTGGSRAEGRSTSVWRDIAGCFSFVRTRVWLWGTLAAASLAYLLFMGPSEVLMPFLVKNELNGSAEDVGMIFAIGGLGAAIAALAVGRGGLPRRTITFIYITWTFATLAIAGYGLASFTWQLMAASFVFNFFEASGTIVWLTAKQRLVPRELLGRVSSFDWLISVGLVPISFALTGPVAALVGARATLVGAGVLGAVVTLAALLLPGMRALEASPAPVPEPAAAG